MTDPTWTVRAVLRWATEDFARLALDSPRLDAELLLAEVLGGDRVRVYMDLDRPLDARELGQMRALVRRRRAREPVAYILGRKEFYGRMFRVDSAVLIPRPETEMLVEYALATVGSASAQVLDLCTGSGALGISLAAERPQWRVVGTDVSAAALAVAADNARRLGVAARMRWRCGDLWSALAAQPTADLERHGSASDPADARAAAGRDASVCDRGGLDGQVLDPKGFDLVVCNPPYIADEVLGALEPEVRIHEPRLALSGGPDGLGLLRAVAASAAAHLRPGGLLLLEIGSDQGESVPGLLRGPGFADPVVHRDFAGHPRMVAVHTAQAGGCSDGG